MNQEKLREMMDYDSDTGVLRWRMNRGSRAKAGQEAGWAAHSGYRQIRISGKTYYAHRLAWLWVHGESPLLIDHIDRNPSNNRLSNLRSADWNVNAQNMLASKRSKSGIRGVFWNKQFGKWKTVLFAGGRNRMVKHFDTQEEAAAAYAEAAAIFHTANPAAKEIA